MKVEAGLRPGDVLYHAEHGPCLIRRIQSAEGLPGGGLCYHLVPQAKSANGSHFFVPVDSTEESGFHLPYSIAEGNKILAYLKKARNAPSASSSEKGRLISELVRENTLWSFARLLVIYSREEQGMRAQGKYRVVVRAARGLIRELAYIFDVSAKSAAAKIYKNLKKGRKPNGWVLEALNHISDEESGWPAAS